MGLVPQGAVDGPDASASALPCARCGLGGPRARAYHSACEATASGQGKRALGPPWAFTFLFQADQLWPTHTFEARGSLGDFALTVQEPGWGQTPFHCYLRFHPTYKKPGAFPYASWFDAATQWKGYILLGQTGKHSILPCCNHPSSQANSESGQMITEKNWSFTGNITQGQISSFSFIS